jgi:hypothetical protein
MALAGSLKLRDEVTEQFGPAMALGGYDLQFGRAMTALAATSQDGPTATCSYSLVASLPTSSPFWIGAIGERKTHLGQRRQPWCRHPRYWSSFVAIRRHRNEATILANTLCILDILLTPTAWKVWKRRG